MEFGKIYEAIRVGVETALLESVISREEAMADYETLEWTDNATKKTLAVKYGIDSKKAKEIQQKISEYLRTLRFNTSIYDEFDLRNFSRLGFYDSYKKEVELFDQEPRQFVEYIKDRRWANLVKKGLDKKLNWGSYGLSIADKSAINRYKNADRYLTEHSAAFKEKVNNIDIIYNILQEQMVEFKKDFINRVEKDARRKYRLLPSLIEDNKLTYKSMQEEFDKWYKEEYEKNRRELWWMVREKKAALDKISDKISRFCGILDKYTEKEYVVEMHKFAEEEFNSNTKAVAGRINEKHIDIDHLTISEVGRDPKYFEMMISDGKQKFYARSILAAEFSEKMVPHFRFIITDRSKF